MKCRPNTMQNIGGAALFECLFGRLVYDRLGPAVTEMRDDGARALFLLRRPSRMDDPRPNDPDFLCAKGTNSLEDCGV